MYQTMLLPEAAIGHILRHNIADASGRKALHKGRRLTTEDAAHLRQLGIEAVPVAIFEAGDIHEDEAARRVAAAVSGADVYATTPAASRVNLLARCDGIVTVDVAGLLQINAVEGVTVATRSSHSLVRACQRIATIKIIPFAIPESALAEVGVIQHKHGPLVAVRPLQPHRVAVILVGSATARERLAQGVYPAIEARVIALGSQVQSAYYVAVAEEAVVAGIAAALETGAELIIIAGETSIMDRDDVTPRAIRLAGGRVEHYGAPVEPGNLLLMAYIDHTASVVPILGAPGCVRSRDTNIVDLLLPRLLSGEHITRDAIIALGHGGLL